MIAGADLISLAVVFSGFIIRSVYVCAPSVDRGGGVEQVRDGLELSPIEGAQGSTGGDLHPGRTPAVCSPVPHNMLSQLVSWC